MSYPYLEWLGAYRMNRSDSSKCDLGIRFHRQPGLRYPPIPLSCGLLYGYVSSVIGVVSMSICLRTFVLLVGDDDVARPPEPATRGGDRARKTASGTCAEGKESATFFPSSEEMKGAHLFPQTEAKDRPE